MTEDRETRGNIMRAVRSSDTKIELTVRRIVRSLGFPGYRLGRRDIPGTPDLAYIGRRKAIFVHGCFWHGHECPRGSRVPKANREYWERKISRNRERDARVMDALATKGWSALIVWECELRDPSLVSEKLKGFLGDQE
jgi:DNA mismatch endonuclease (patch repair protein)